MLTVMYDNNSHKHKEFIDNTSSDVFQKVSNESIFDPGMFETHCNISETNDLESIFSLNLHQQRSTLWPSLDQIDDGSSDDQSKLCCSLINSGSLCGERLQKTGRVSESHPKNPLFCPSSDPQFKQDCETRFSTPTTLKNKCLLTLKSLIAKNSTKSEKKSISENELSDVESFDSPTQKQVEVNHSSTKVGSARISKQASTKRTVLNSESSKIDFKKGSKRKL